MSNQETSQNVIINIGGKDIKISVEEAMYLRANLNRAFADNRPAEAMPVLAPKLHWHAELTIKDLCPN